MKAIAQSEVISLISDLIAFADHAEGLIRSTQTAYERNRQQILNRHQAEMVNLENTYRRNYGETADQVRQTIQEARRILGEIERLDIRLASIDKYYVRTKQQREGFLSNTTSERYAGSADYFLAMERIRTDFQRISKKYSEDILPGLLNGLNYYFSAQRKKDYEELIILKNTVSAFVREIETTLPAMAENNLAGLTDFHTGEVSAAAQRHKQEMTNFESQHSAELEKLADRICMNLENILPDEFVDYLAAMTSRYAENVQRVNTSSIIPDDVLDMIFVDFPVDDLVGSSLVASLIRDKCSALLSGKDIRFPIMMSTRDAPVWIVQSDHSSATQVQGFIHSVMYGFLLSCPVANLTFRVVDPENRGNSIAPFFDAKKKLPELFGERILIQRDDVASQISRLNERIESILQDRLGNQYDSIFDCAMQGGESSVQVELLLLYDFPRGFDERTLGELRSIIRNGRRCGIFTVISYVPPEDRNPSGEFQRNLQSILDLSIVIQQTATGFTYRGLPIAYYPLPEKAEFVRIFSRYMLICEGIRNRGIAFTPLIRKLVDASDTIGFAEQINVIGRMMNDYRRAYGQVPGVDALFPSTVTLGSVFYPADIFSDSFGYQRILETFGVRQRGNENSAFVELPLTFDPGNSFNLFLNCPESQRSAMLRFSHHVIWSFLSFMPVTKTNVCVFDAEQRGNSMIPFLDFRKKSPDTFDQKIYTSHEAMVERLQTINGHIDEFIQEKLGNRYRDIFQYNAATPNRAEPVTLLVVYDFPGGMDGRSLDLLMNILRNGNQCGVFTVICYNPDVTYSRYESIDERLEQIQKYCISIDYRDGQYGLLPYNLQIRIPEPLSERAADAFVSEYTRRCEAIRKKGLSFRDILSRDLFSMDSSRSLTIPVGVGDGDSIVSLKIGEGSSHHGLIAGATGSGKSTLLHTIIMSSMLHYSPDQLHLYLMDFKSGTEFKIYESVRLPHIQLLALDAMQEFGESILENLVAEMERRGSLFKEAGQTSLNGYKQATGKPLPRILVIMDEFQILFNDSSNRKVAMNCAELTKRIVTEGRAFGIHLLMATQSTKVITDLTLSHGTIEQMRIRIGLKCGESDARYLFSDENDAKALAMMKGPIGTAVMNLDYTEQANIGFRAAYCDDTTQHELLEMISSHFADRPYSLQTFEGGRTTGLLDYFASAGITRTDELPVRIHMGTLIKVAPPFAITVDRKRKHNLLICGANERMAALTSGNYMISALLNSHASVYCMDGDILVGEDGSAAFYHSLGQIFSRFRLAGDRGDIIRMINEVFTDYQGLKKHNGDQAIFVVIRNLQFLDLVKAMLKGENVDEREYLDESPEEAAADPADPFAAVNGFFDSRSSDDGLSVGEKLLRLISDGSAYGIHFVVTSLEYQTVRECMYYGENILTRFPERIIFSLGGNDADSLIENVSVSGLRENTVYYTDGVRNTFQMKPYVLPSPEQLQAFFGDGT